MSTRLSSIIVLTVNTRSLAWAEVGGHSVIPKSVTTSRIIENFVQVELTDDEVAGVNVLGKENLRFNVPWVANTPKWPINIFGHPDELATPHKVIL